MNKIKKRHIAFTACFLALGGLACNVLATSLPVTPTLSLPTTTSEPPTPTFTALPPSATVAPAIPCSEEIQNVLEATFPNGPKAETLSEKTKRQETNDYYTITIYDVKDESITLASDEPVPDNLAEFQGQKDIHQDIWNFFATLIPGEWGNMLQKFIIITDGNGELMAAVRQTEENITTWTLIVDIADSTNSRSLTYTLIHEFAHLLTLNSKQVIPSVAMFENPGNSQIFAHEELRCKQYFSGHGCSNPDSYLNMFYQSFWTEIRSDWDKVEESRSDEQYIERLNGFYQKHYDRFLTDYAIVNPVEDIAESFSFFVLSSKPTGDTMAEKKILFFYDFPELVKLRAEIRSNICQLQP